MNNATEPVSLAYLKTFFKRAYETQRESREALELNENDLNHDLALIPKEHRAEYTAKFRDALKLYLSAKINLNLIDKYASVCDKTKAIHKISEQLRLLYALRDTVRDNKNK